MARLAHLLPGAVLAVSLYAQGIISTFAGSGNVVRGENVPATSIALGFPTGVALDRAGNVYIAEGNGIGIRKVTPAGIISTFAGSPTGTFPGTGNGDGGPAVGAGVGPWGLAFDAAGNLYFTEVNNRIRKIATNGIISTIAGTGSAAFSGDGGPALAATMQDPRGIAVDAAGNIYFADSTNNRVRKIAPNGIITTVAGGATRGFAGDGGPAVNAALFHPQGVAVDAAGNLDIADYNNSRIRKVDPAGIITTFAGNGTVVSFIDNVAATASGINLPFGVATDNLGNVLIVDSSNARIRKVNAAGVITTVAGGGIEGFNSFTYTGPALSAYIGGPYAVASDATGNLYLATPAQHVVRKVTYPAGPAISANGVVSGASYLPGVVPNSWTTILGTSLANSTRTWDGAIVNGALPTSLDGVSVTIGGQPAFINYISPGQLNVIAPDIGVGPQPVVVTTPSGVSTSYTTTSILYGPAFFLWPGNQVVATRQDFSFAVRNGTFAGATTIAAKPGDVLILWGTGFGPTSPAAPPGRQVPSDRTYSTVLPPQITINSVAATVFGAALAPGFAGLYQVAIQVPASLPEGDWPLRALVGGQQSPATVVLAVRR